MYDPSGAFFVAPSDRDRRQTPGGGPQGFGGMNGHLGSASKPGVWPEGLVYFGQFLAARRN